MLKKRFCAHLQLTNIFLYLKLILIITHTQNVNYNSKMFIKIQVPTNLLNRKSHKKSQRWKSKFIATFNIKVHRIYLNYIENIH